MLPFPAETTRSRHTGDDKLPPQIRVRNVGFVLSTTVGVITIIEAYCLNQVNLTDQSSAALKQFILTGDLNARHEVCGNTRRNQNEKILWKDLEKGDYIIMCPDAPALI